MSEQSPTPPKDQGEQKPQNQGQSATGAGAAGAAGPTAATATTAAVAWYARPWIWSLLLFLLLAAYAGWLLWLQWQAHAALKLNQENLVVEQQARNAQLEADAARLREALNTDPCVAQGILRDYRVPTPLNPQTPHSSLSPADTAPPPTQTPSAPDKSTAPELERKPANDADKAPAKGATEAEAPPPGMQQEDKKLPADTGGNYTPPPPPKNVAELLEQATVLILTQSPKGVMMGTGFFIAPGIVLTNQHVIGTGKYPMIVVGKFKGIVTEAQSIAVSTTKGRDYAVLKVPVTTVKPLDISLDVSRTQKVSAWGFPGAVTGDDPKFQALLQSKPESPPEVVYTDGSVSVVLERKPPLIVHSAVVSQGNSGGPLVNEKGQVVGITTYIRLDEESYRQSSIAIVGKDIVAFLKEHRIPFTLAPASSGKE